MNILYLPTYLSVSAFNSQKSKVLDVWADRLTKTSSEKLRISKDDIFRRSASTFYLLTFIKLRSFYFLQKKTFAECRKMHFRTNDEKLHFRTTVL